MGTHLECWCHVPVKGGLGSKVDVTCIGAPVVPVGPGTQHLGGKGDDMIHTVGSRVERGQRSGRALPPRHSNLQTNPLSMPQSPTILMGPLLAADSAVYISVIAPMYGSYQEQMIMTGTSANCSRWPLAYSPQRRHLSEMVSERQSSKM